MREPEWKSYIVVEPEPILTPQQCQELIRLGQAEPQSDGAIMVAGHPDKKDYTARKSEISWIPFDKAPKIYSDLLGWMQLVNRNHFGFEGMEMHEAGQYSEYSKGDFYKWHIDIGVNATPMPPVRKISLSLLLNDPKEFEGGELEIFLMTQIIILFINLNKVKLSFLLAFMFIELNPLFQEIVRA